MPLANQHAGGGGFLFLRQRTGRRPALLPRPYPPRLPSYLARRAGIGVCDHSADDGSPEPPVDLLDKALVELGIVGAFRALAYALVEPVRIVADQDAPAPLLHPIQEGFCLR